LAVSLRLICLAETTTPKVDSAAPVPRITIRVYNYARVSNDVLAEAKNSATTIFLQAHVETQWLACRLSMGDTHGDVNCQRAFGPTDLVVRILPRLKVGQPDFLKTTAGFSVPCRADEPGFIANVF